MALVKVLSNAPSPSIEQHCHREQEDFQEKISQGFSRSRRDFGGVGDDSQAPTKLPGC